MATALAFLFPTAFGVGGSIALTTATGLTLAGSIVNIGGSLLLSAALQPKPPSTTPENIQLNIRQAMGPRVIPYGQVKFGGTVVFHRAREGKFYRVIAHGHGQIDSILAYELDKNVVTLDGSGFVTEAQYQNGGRSRVQILIRDGAAVQAHFAEIEAVWPAYDSAHRLNGIWCSLTIAEQVSADDFREMYPNGEPPLSITARGRGVYDLRSGATAWSDNAALVIADYIGHPDGFNLPGMMDDAALTLAANDSADAIALAAGGTEPRYRLWGSVALTERPGDVLTRMLAGCAGEVRLLPNGKIGLSVGKWREPGVTLDASELIEITSWTNGPDKLDRYTELPWIYVDPTLDYQSTTGETWIDPVRQAQNGEIAVGPQADFSMAPSSTQGDRLAKQRIEVDNPAHIIAARFKPSARRALFERFIGLNVPELPGAWWRVQSYNLSLVDGSVLLVLHSFDPASISWSSDEEGVPFVPPAPDDTRPIPTPTGVTATGGAVQVNQQVKVAAITVSWNAPPRDALSVIVEYGQEEFGISGRTPFSEWPVSEDATLTVISPLTDGTAYDVRVFFRTSDGRNGPAVLVEEVVALADPVPPVVAGNLTVLDQGGGEALVSLDLPNIDNLWKTELMRGVTMVRTWFGQAGMSVSATDAPGAGTHDWFAVTYNTSGVATPTAPVTQTIT